jgi:osmoprotectant transport system ATP-binding protein
MSNARDMKPMIKLENLSKSYDGGATFVVKDLCLEVESGETVVLLGSSGSGKSTTLKMINRLIEPSSGRVTMDNTDLSAMDPVQLRRKFGYVFQEIGLFPHMTIEENICVVPKLLGWTTERRHDRATELLNLVNLAPNRFRYRLPNELSGGQQQRVGVARALAADPSYLLMDEPFGALDAVTRDNLQSEIVKIRGALHKTIIFVTHDIFEALTMGDRIGVMNDGKLEQIGPARELLHNPASAFVHELFDKPAKQLTQYGTFSGR